MKICVIIHGEDVVGMETAGKIRRRVGDAVISQQSTHPVIDATITIKIRS